jgi:hypothetical protein
MVRFPDDPALAPLLNAIETSTPVEEVPTRVPAELVETARQIEDDTERSRAMLEIARGAILSNQLILAHRALEEGSLAATRVQNRLRHDQLTIEIVALVSLFTETLIREGKYQPVPIEPADPAAIPTAPPLDSRNSIRLARLEWRRAAILAQEIFNPTYRAEYLERLVENMAAGSGRIYTEYVRLPQPESAAETDPSKRRRDQDEFARIADEILVESAALARRIERPIWRNYALVKIAITAGESRQFARGVQIARMAENPEARAQGLLLVAESQCRFGQPEAATETYTEVAAAIARVRQDGLRGVLTGFLVDSLISTGRFEDARACLGLYPTESERFVALSAIAESQGRRNAAASAREWIAREAPPAYRAALLRRVNNGVLEAIEANRANTLPGRELPGADVNR